MEGRLLLSINFGSSPYTSFVQQTIVCQRVLNIGRLNYMYRPWGTVWCTSMCVGGGGGGGGRGGGGGGGGGEMDSHAIALY